MSPKNFKNLSKIFLFQIPFWNCLNPDKKKLFKTFGLSLSSFDCINRLMELTSPLNLSKKIIESMVSVGFNFFDGNLYGDNLFSPLTKKYTCNLLSTFTIVKIKFTHSSIGRVLIKSL